MMTSVGGSTVILHLLKTVLRQLEMDQYQWAHTNSLPPKVTHARSFAIVLQINTTDTKTDSDITASD